MIRRRHRSRQHISALHLFDSHAEGTNDAVEVIGGMRCRKEAGIALKNMNTLLAHLVIEQAAKPSFRRQGEVEPCAAGIHAHLDSSVAEDFLYSLCCICNFTG